MLLTSHNLARIASTEHEKFCECFIIVVADEALSVCQQDVLNILESWIKTCLIDEDELVWFAVNIKGVMGNAFYR